MFEQRISASGSTASWSCSRAAERLHGREMSAHGVTLMCLCEAAQGTAAGTGNACTPSEVSSSPGVDVTLYQL